MAKKRRASVVRTDDKTVGQYVADRVAQSEYLDFDITKTTKDVVLDYQQKYIENLEEAAMHAMYPEKCKLALLPDPPATHDKCLTEPPKEGDFYIISMLLHDEKLNYSIKNKFFATSACPTPMYDQSVYKFKRATQEIEYLWTVPDKLTVEIWSQDKTAMEPENLPLLDMILKFKSGELQRMSDELNGAYDGSKILH